MGMQWQRAAVLTLAACIGVPSCTSARSLGLGAYVGNSPADLAQFERWLGRPVDHIAAHTGRANWRDWIGSIKWSLSLWVPVGKPIAWTIPLFVNEREPVRCSGWKVRRILSGRRARAGPFTSHERDDLRSYWRGI